MTPSANAPFDALRQVPAAPVQPVQKGVWYAPDLRFMAFDIALENDSGASGALSSAKGQWVCFNGYEDFGDPGPKWLRMTRRMAQKAIRRLLSRFRWFPTDRIFGRFEPGSECHSFQKAELREFKFRDLGGPKMARKRHFWIAELASFKMRYFSAFFAGRIAISRPFRFRFRTENRPIRTQLRMSIFPGRAFFLHDPVTMACGSTAMGADNGLWTQ